MPSTLAVERGLVLGDSGRLVVDPENWRPPEPKIGFIRDLPYPIGDNSNPAGLEAQHIFGILAASPSASKFIFRRL